MLGTLLGKHNSDPIKVTASSLGSCEGKSQWFISLYLSALLYWMKKWTRKAAVNSTREKLENAALFLRLGLSSTLIHRENGAFRTGGI